MVLHLVRITFIFTLRCFIYFRQIELKKMADQVNEMRETFAVELKSAGLLVGSLYQQFILHTLMYIVYACKSVK